MVRKILIGLTALTTVFSTLCLSSCGNDSSQETANDTKIESQNGKDNSTSGENTSTSSITENTASTESNDDKTNSEETSSTSSAVTTTGVAAENNVVLKSIDQYQNKARLKIANVYARAAYTAVIGYLSDIEAAGKKIEVSKISGEYTISQLNENDDFQKQLKQMVEGNDNDKIYVVVKNPKSKNISTTDDIQVQYIAYDHPELIGQYPNCPTTIEASKSIQWGKNTEF